MSNAIEICVFGMFLPCNIQTPQPKSGDILNLARFDIMTLRTVLAYKTGFFFCIFLFTGTDFRCSGHFVCF